MNRLPSRIPLFSKKKLPKRVIISYILDYVIIASLIIGFTLLDAIEPYHQHFSLKNYTLQYPFAVKERVPVPLAAFLCVACPAAIIAVYALAIDGMFSHSSPAGSQGRLRGRYRFKNRLWELNCGILGLLLSVAAAITITGALKNATGKPRPDVIARCLPKEGSADPAVFGLVTSEICTQKNHAILKDGFRSFPSGHSSTAFAGLFYLSLYLAAKLHILDNRGEVWKTFIVLVPTLGAALIADSRIMDARHHPFDVLSGSLLGIVVAWCSYRQYFPPVSEHWKKGRAYPIRTWGRSSANPADRDPSMIGDEALEPFRQPEMRPTDEEEGGVGYSSAAATRTGGDNVFRKQISESQRLRQQAYQAGQVGGSQPYSQQDPLPPPPPPPKHTAPLITDPDPFASNGNRRRNRRDDDYDDTSSEDPDENIELEHTYTLTDARNQMNVQSFSAAGDTGYQSPSVLPSHSQPAPQPPEVGNASPPLAPQPQRKPVALPGGESLKKEDNVTGK
ncbi:MAG: hypothetical protein M1839_007397 [Geoglossum umbratile]|nr:MAG: hypothetical protein M1839_007397 [Geoglossum umbratile]